MAQPTMEEFQQILVLNNNCKNIEEDNEKREASIEEYYYLDERFQLGVFNQFKDSYQGIRKWLGDLLKNTLTKAVHEWKERLTKAIVFTSLSLVFLSFFSSLKYDFGDNYENMDSTTQLCGLTSELFIGYTLKGLCVFLVIDFVFLQHIKIHVNWNLNKTALKVVEIFHSLAIVVLLASNFGVYIYLHSCSCELVKELQEPTNRMHQDAFGITFWIWNTVMAIISFFSLLLLYIVKCQGNIVFPEQQDVI